MRPVGAELLHAGKRMDRHDEAIHNFAQAPKMVGTIVLYVQEMSSRRQPVSC